MVMNANENSQALDMPAGQDAGQDDGQDDGGENLDHLAREAASIDGQPAQAAAAEMKQINLALVKSNAAELLATLIIARKLALPILGKHKAELLREVWTDEVLNDVSEAAGECLAIHDQAVGDLMGKYAPYVVLVGALVRPVLETREILLRPDPKPLNPVRTENNVFPFPAPNNG